MDEKNVLTSKPTTEETAKNMNVELEKIDEPELFSMRDIKASNITELAENIKNMGRLVNPLFLRPSKKQGRYELVCGHRRLKALRQLKWKNAPCRIQCLSDDDAFALAISENIGRSDPSPLEEARAYLRARDQFKMSLDSIAEKVGKDKSTISNRIRLLSLSDKVIDAVEKNIVSPGHCEHGFMRLKHSQDQETLLQSVKQQARWGNRMSVKDVEQQTKELIKNRGKIEAWAEYQRINKDRILTPKCPKCGGPVDPDNYRTDLTKNRVSCSNYCSDWNPLKTPAENKKIIAAEYGGHGSGMLRSAREEPQNKNEARAHKSLYPIVDFFREISRHVVENSLVTGIRTESAGGYGESQGIEMIVKLKTPDGFPLPDAFKLEGKDYKNSGHKTSISLGDMYSYDNKTILKQRKQLWELETILGKKEKASIIRVPMNRLVLEHKALSKGTELKITNNGKLQGTWVIQTVHRDYTAYIMNPKNEKIFMEEKELRILIKAAFPQKTKGKKKRKLGCTDPRKTTTPGSDEQGSQSRTTRKCSKCGVLHINNDDYLTEKDKTTCYCGGKLKEVSEQTYREIKEIIKKEHQGVGGKK